eukprot:TRINITY_DN2309_c0_g2_i1.p1 TRINITY_DN2309_c0_g2~~TRINITY_DN2309_c0_g2_i1.p1  ORF type:complete len:1410 (-),score=208.13 TRINITY_DN2309_c0_g2_i1:69-3836(-)
MAPPIAAPPQVPPLVAPPIASPSQASPLMEAPPQGPPRIAPQASAPAQAPPLMAPPIAAPPQAPPLMAPPIAAPPQGPQPQAPPLTASPIAAPPQAQQLPAAEPSLPSTQVAVASDSRMPATDEATQAPPSTSTQTQPSTSTQAPPSTSTQEASASASTWTEVLPISWASSRFDSTLEHKQAYLCAGIYVEDNFRPPAHPENPWTTKLVRDGVTLALHGDDGVQQVYEILKNPLVKRDSEGNAEVPVGSQVMQHDGEIKWFDNSSSSCLWNPDVDGNGKAMILDNTFAAKVGGQFCQGRLAPFPKTATIAGSSYFVWFKEATGLTALLQTGETVSFDRTGGAISNSELSGTLTSQGDVLWSTGENSTCTTISPSNLSPSSLQVDDVDVTGSSVINWTNINQSNVNNFIDSTLSCYVPQGETCEERLQEAWPMFRSLERECSLIQEELAMGSYPLVSEQADTYARMLAIGFERMRSAAKPTKEVKQAAAARIASLRQAGKSLAELASETLTARSGIDRLKERVTTHRERRAPFDGDAKAALLRRAGRYHTEPGGAGTIVHPQKTASNRLASEDEEIVEEPVPGSELNDAAGARTMSDGPGLQMASFYHIPKSVETSLSKKEGIPQLSAKPTCTAQDTQPISSAIEKYVATGCPTNYVEMGEFFYERGMPEWQVARKEKEMRAENDDKANPTDDRRTAMKTTQSGTNLAKKRWANQGDDNPTTSQESGSIPSGNSSSFTFNETKAFQVTGGRLLVFLSWVGGASDMSLLVKPPQRPGHRGMEDNGQGIKCNMQFSDQGNDHIQRVMCPADGSRNGPTTGEYVVYVEGGTTFSASRTYNMHVIVGASDGPEIVPSVHYKWTDFARRQTAIHRFQMPPPSRKEESSSLRLPDLTCKDFRCGDASSPVPNTICMVESHYGCEEPECCSPDEWKEAKQLVGFRVSEMPPLEPLTKDVSHLQLGAGDGRSGMPLWKRIRAKTTASNRKAECLSQFQKIDLEVEDVESECELREQVSFSSMQVTPSSLMEQPSVKGSCGIPEIARIPLEVATKGAEEKLLSFAPCKGTYKTVTSSPNAQTVDAFQARFYVFREAFKDVEMRMVAVREGMEMERYKILANKIVGLNEQINGTVSTDGTITWNSGKVSSCVNRKMLEDTVKSKHLSQVANAVPFSLGVCRMRSHLLEKEVLGLDSLCGCKVPPSDGTCDRPCRFRGSTRANETTCRNLVTDGFGEEHEVNDRYICAVNRLCKNQCKCGAGDFDTR